MAEKLFRYAEEGHTCVITTYRSKKYEDPQWIVENFPTKVRVEDFIKEHGLPISEIYFTEHEDKGPVLREIGADVHYDDDIEAVFSAERLGIHAVYVELKDENGKS
jgi:hypothetical protein